VHHLNAPEQLELTELLRAAGVDLGSRSRLRRLSDQPADVPTTAASSHESFRPDQPDVGPRRGGDSLQPRRVQTKEGVVEADVKGGGGLSMDTLALLSTAVLGLATFMLQAQVAKNAEAAQRAEGSGAGAGGAGAGAGAGGGAVGAGAEPDERRLPAGAGLAKPD
jgi:hypothetical protein